MATAKKNPTGNRVQGHRSTKDPLDKLIAIAIRVAQREGLLEADPSDDLGTDARAERGSGDRRSA
jgi:hypothetical protein